MVFPVDMYECENWTIKMAEHGRIGACELWCWRRLWRVPWTARRSNQSILKKINPEYSHWKDWCWSWSSNTLATWYKELTHLKRPNAGKYWRQEKGTAEDGMVGWYPTQSDMMFDSMDISLSKLQEMVRLSCSPCVHKEVDTTELLNDWTITTGIVIFLVFLKIYLNILWNFRGHISFFINSMIVMIMVKVCWALTTYQVLFHVLSIYQHMEFSPQIHGVSTIIINLLWMWKPSDSQ